MIGEIMQRGQTAIEFIFIILIIVVYLFTITTPMINSAKSAYSDIETVTKANAEAQKLVNAIERVSSLSNGTKETIYLSLPENCVLNCTTDNKIEVITKINLDQINPVVNECPNNICDKNYSTQPITCITKIIVGSQSISIRKENGNTIINKG
jgi:hypothetical protein